MELNTAENTSKTYPGTEFSYFKKHLKLCFTES